jgi:sec-independent protein translocase protein TatB
MEILGIGISELIFIIIIALLVLGPKDMQKAGMTIGKWLRRIVTSDGWKVFQQTSRELRTLPNKLIREANEDLNRIGSEITNASNLPPDLLEEPKPHPRSKPVSDSKPPQKPADNKILPPEIEKKDDESDQSKNA